MSKQHKRSKAPQVHIGRELIDEVWSLGLGIYLFAVLVVLPLYTYDHYWNMAWQKWKVYLSSTCCMLIFAIGLWMVGRVYRFCKRKSQDKEATPKNIVDLCMMLYGVALILSFLTCQDKRAAWMGAEGWYMGTVPQLIMVATYFVFCKRKVSPFILLIFHGGASAICYFYGICQRLGFDWIHLYYVMPAEVKRDYLSFIGNRTWFSAYICIAFPIGVYLYWYCEKGWKCILAGVYTFLAFMCMVTVNSDSMYAGLMVVMYVLAVFSIGYIDKWKRFWELVVMLFGAGLLMHLLLQVWFDATVNYRGLTRLFLNVKITLPMVLIAVVVRLGLSLADGSLKCKFCKSLKALKIPLGVEERKKKQWKVLIVSGILLVLLILLIWLNSSGVLEFLLGHSLNNSYLLFNDSWGDYRGHTWKMTLQMFGDLPLTQKLFGVGPDCYGYGAYSNPEYAGILQAFWGDQVLLNAHNELLNQLFCVGILGGLIYLGLFLAVLYECLVRIDRNKIHPLVPAIGLCVLAYMAHNFFCYQQICATPVLFMLMGMAVQFKKNSMEDKR